MTRFHIRQRIHGAALRLAAATANQRPELDFRASAPEHEEEPIIEVCLRFYQPAEGGTVAVEQVLTKVPDGVGDRTIADWLAFYSPRIGEALQTTRWAISRREVA